MRVLITRPESDTEDLSARIIALGCAVSVAPMMTIVVQTISKTAIANATALIVTSRNAVKALAASPDALNHARTLPVYAVGKATALLVRDIGIDHIVMGGGTAQQLVPIIVDAQGAATGDFVHLSGDHVAFDLQSALRTHGISLRSVVTYRSVSASALPDDVIAELARGQIDAVMLMSPRTTEIFVRLATEAGLRQALARLTYLCLSEAVADALSPLQLGQSSGDSGPRVMVAENPTLEDMLNLVRRLASQSGAG